MGWQEEKFGRRGKATTHAWLRRSVARFLWGRKMDIYDFGDECAQTYTGKCKCGRVIEVSTQEDRSPEYETTVYVRCVCGKSVKFILPVN